MKTKLLAIAIFAVSIPAMATNPKPPEPDNPSSSATSSSVSGDSKAIANGGDSTASQKQGQSFNSDISNSLGNISPTANSDSINHLKGGDVLAAGVTTGSNSFSGGGGGGAGGAGGQASADNKLSNVGNSNVEITHEAEDLSETVPNVILQALVVNGCIGSGSAGLSVPGLGIGGGKTVEHERCTRLLYAAAVDSYGTTAHRALSFEITCGDYVVLEADLLMNTHLCMKNEPNGSNVTIPAYVSRPVVLQELAANISGRK